MNIGLTGGIATGKSTVANLFIRRGAKLIDADAIAREVVLPGSPVLSEVAARFGQDVLLPDGSLDRKKLGNLVFSDEGARMELNAIMHPPIRKIMKDRMENAEAENPDIMVVVDVPLLFESNLGFMFSEVMVVYVPRDVQLHRLMARDGISVEQAEARLNAQMPIEEKKKLADFVIDNSGTNAETERQVAAFLRGKGIG